MLSQQIYVKLYLSYQKYLLPVGGASYWFRNALKTKQNLQLSRRFKKATLYYRLQRQYINLMHNQRRI